MLLDDRVAIITGASRGIGRAIALHLAKQGANVVINYTSRPEAAESVAEEIRTLGRRVLVHQADISDAMAAAGLVDATVKDFGRLDILVNNAGITRDGLLVRMREEDWDRVLTVNLKGAFNTVRAAGRYLLKARWGRIVNISSIIGLRGNPGQVNYAAAKAGLIGMTKSLAKELGSRNITVNAVAPGFITTEMTASLASEDRERMQKDIPLGRLGKPEDVAALVGFLVGEDAGYITGQVIAVDGGMAI